MPAESLRALQERFYALVTAPEGVEAALRELGLTAEQLAEDVRGDARLSAVARLDVYANMYFYRILDVLRDEHDKVVAVVGDAAFHDLVTSYLVAHRPAHPSLRDVGRRFAAFLKGHAAPWLSELAQLERARLEVFDAADDDPLSLDVLRAVPATDLAELVVRRSSASLVLTTSHAVEQLWQAIEQGEPWSAPEAAPRELLVWRADALVHQRGLEPIERALWPSLTDGISVALLCEHVAELADDADVAALAFRLLGGWASDGLLTRV